VAASLKELLEAIELDERAAREEAQAAVALTAKVAMDNAELRGALLTLDGAVGIYLSDYRVSANELEAARRKVQAVLSR
jgi:hypothetical protein